MKVPALNGPLRIVAPSAVSYVLAGCLCSAHGPSSTATLHPDQYVLAQRTRSEGTGSGARIRVPAGHYRVIARLTCSGGETAETLSSVLSVALRIEKKDEQTERRELLYPLKIVRTRDICDGRPHELELAEESYPNDSGWIQSDTAVVSADITSRAPERLAVEALTLERTSWSLTSEARITRASALPILPIIPAPHWITEAPDSSPPGLGRVAREGAVDDRLAAEIDRYLGATNVCRDGETPRLLFRLGDWSCAQEAPAHICQEAKRHSEAYHVRADSSGWIIESESEAGLTYALDTLSQARAAGLVVKEIVDYPAVDFRAVGGNDPARTGYANEARAGSFLREGRFNVQMIETSTYESEWWSPSARLRALIARIVSANAKRSDLSAGVMINPYIIEIPGFGFEYSDARTRHHFLDLLRFYQRIGVETFMLRSDDVVPTAGASPFSYGLTSENDKRLFGSLGALHANLVNDAFRTLHRPFRLEFVPPWYNWRFALREPALARAYARDFREHLLAAVDLVWTGPSVRSLTIDPFTTRAFSSEFGAGKLTLWDNSTFARRHKDFWLDKSGQSERLSFFEPYQVEGDWIPEHKGVFVNAQFFERTRVQLVTAGSYLWNPDAYEPYRILWTYLVRRFGAAGAKKLVSADAVLWRAHARLLRKDAIDTEEVQRTIERTEALRNVSSGDNVTLLDELLAKMRELVGNQD